jgi:formylglycine-generating enzyme required for sulfatase activity
MYNALSNNRYGLWIPLPIDYQMKMYLKKTIMSGCFLGYLLSPILTHWFLPHENQIEQVSDASCYSFLIQKGQEAFAAGRYHDALKKYVAARDCPDKPRGNDLETRIQMVSNRLSSHKGSHESARELPRAQPVREQESTPLTPKGNYDSQNLAKTRYELEAEKLRAERERITAQARDRQHASDMQDIQLKSALQAEMSAWEMTQSANSEATLLKYLEKYPNGLYSKVARQQLSALENKPKSEVKTPISKNASARETLKSIELVEIEGGHFAMGDASSRYADEKPVRNMQLPSFYLSKFEVTESEWFAVIGKYPAGSTAGNCAICPIRMVSWQDAQNFIGKLNTLTGQTYRLPTEVEWEYAAKGGQSGNARFSGSNEPDAAGWYERNAEGKVHPVGQKNANELGLFDMTGNVREWCLDLYNEKAYEKTTPPRFELGTQRVFRGGSWDDEADFCRNAVRAREQPHYRDERTGFRLAQNK